jgi:hypothetical protein
MSVRADEDVGISTRDAWRYPEPRNARIAFA